MPITVHHLQIHDTHRPHHSLDYKTICPYPRTFELQNEKRRYVLSCKKCGLQYVGQTGNTFNERFRAHLTDIRQGNAFKQVSRHFTSYNHSTDDVIATIVTQSLITSTFAFGQKKYILASLIRDIQLVLTSSNKYNV